MTDRTDEAVRRIDEFIRTELPVEMFDYNPGVRVKSFLMELRVILTTPSDVPICLKCGKPAIGRCEYVPVAERGRAAFERGVQDYAEQK